MVTEEKTKVANVEKVFAGRESWVDLCVGGSSLLVQMCVCGCVRVSGDGRDLELPDVEWATCLSGPKHRNFPLTAEINQSLGNLYSMMRREDVSVSLYMCLFVGG